MNEEDGQADVEQDHHADEDGVGDLGIAQRGRLSPPASETCPPQVTARLDTAAVTYRRLLLRVPPPTPFCSLLCPAEDSRPSEPEDSEK